MIRPVKRLARLILPESVCSFLQLPYRRVATRIIMARRLHLAGLRIKRGLPVIPRREKIAIGFHVVEHCNLNCACCDNFSPLAEREFIDPEIFRRDMERLGSIFNHECQRVSLLGGEPLLHPELVKFIEISRENFRTGNIHVLTNGILLTRQGPDFWKACHDNDAAIIVTHYPINIDVQGIRELARQYDVKLQLHDMTKSIFYKRAVDLRGRGNPGRNFGACIRNDCITLGHNGQLFTCTFASNIHHFNKKFGMNVPITESDYIDIYKESDPERILRRLSEPIPMCSFCDMYYEPVRWHPSTLDISEWV